MTITERERHDMLRALETALGEEAAMTLAGHLPPVGWADVATKADVEHLGQIMQAQFELVWGKFDEIDRRFEEVQRRFEEIERRFEDMDRRFEVMERRFEDMDRRFEVMERRFEEVERRFDQLELTIDSTVRIAMANFQTEVGDRFATQTRVLYLAIISTVITLIGLGLLSH